MEAGSFSFRRYPPSQQGRLSSRRSLVKARHHRAGVAIFVDFVSKRIHPTALEEAFEEYGRVLDVYVAYNNLRRLKKNYTFAFVRFCSLEEALKAVELANNRRMDGFFIKVFMSHADGKSGRDPAKTKVARIKHMQNKNVDLSKLTNGRSYKEVLMDKLTPGLGRFHHPKSVGGSNKPANATDRAFEDESCWIDACSPNGQIDAVPSVSIDEGDSCRLEDYAPNNHYPAAEALPKSVENDNVSSFNDAAQTRVSMEANYKEPSFHGQQRNSVDNINNLIEIPVRSVSETSKNSMGSSAATAPVLDSKTGLFTIKPKCIKNPRAWNDYLLRSKLERMQSSASNRQTPKKQNLGKKKVLEHGSSPINVFTIGKASPKFPPSKHSNRSSEARMTLEVCNMVGIQFDAKDEVVCDRLAQLDAELPIID
ncbi:hypothetical protein V6N11_006840 [Hibiscus sabdariffa]|uniref:RRM domain-containing protein n=1 Tax=Hibiscus sabdariffa TaxID=183260 RepID=A0ABR2RRV3_9ROSI